ncbi:MAG: flippase [Colwelliaceae bacterium]|nr:flippase [Colwelliaceae bacterium]
MVPSRLNKNFVKYFTNSAWLLSEYALRVVSAIFVTVYVARYIGPESFGILTYALAIVSIFMAISRLGMDSILVRELAKKTEKIPIMLGTAFWLMFTAAILSLAVLFGVVHLIEPDTTIRLYIWIIASGIVFQTIYVVDYSFQSQVKAKYSSIAKSLALVTSSLLKIYFVNLEVELSMVVVAFALDFVLIAIFLLITHVLTKQSLFFTQFDKSLFKPLLKSAWPMMLSALAIVLYMRVDQIMIKNMLGAHELGLYSAGTRIYEGWIMIFSIISVSLLPMIVKLKDSSLEHYEKRLSQLFTLLFWMAMFGAVFATLYGEEIIYLAFGDEFTQAKTVFVLVMWSASFAAIGSLTARYLVVEGMEKKIALRTIVALIVNVLLNFILIPLYGIDGAAIATLIAIIIGNYLINYFDNELAQLRRINNKVIFFR